MNDSAGRDARSTSLDERIAAVLDSAERLFLATSVDGNSSGASVFFARDGDDLVFFTFNPSRKAEQIRVNPNVQAVVWPGGQQGIRGLQIAARCERIRDPDKVRRAREAILGVTRAFEAYMDDEFLRANDVVGYYRLRPTLIKYVDFHAPAQFEWREFPDNRPAAWREATDALRARTLLWLRALRAPFFTATLVPVLLGATIAWGDLRATGAQTWDWARFAWMLLGALLAHAGTNLANDYGDHLSRNDEWNKVPSPFNGGSRVIQAGLLAPWKIALAAALCFAGTVAVGLYLNADIGGAPFAATPILWAGLAGCALGAAYTLGPFRLSYRGFGEVAVALGFGPVMVLGAHYVMSAGATAPWNWGAPLLASLPVATLVAMIIWINEFQDVPADRAAGKNTWLVRLAEGPGGEVRYERALRAYEHLGAIALGCIVLLGVLGFVEPRLASPFALLALLGLWPGILALRWARQWLARWNAPDADRQRLPYELLKVNAATIGLHLLTGLLLIAGYALHAWIG